MRSLTITASALVLAAGLAGAAYAGDTPAGTSSTPAVTGSDAGAATTPAKPAHHRRHHHHHKPATAAPAADSSDASTQTPANGQ